MQLKHTNEFQQLFQEFKTSFVDTPAGAEHISFYDHHRQSGRQNFAELQVVFTEQGISGPTQMTDELARRVLNKLLPHSNSENHQQQGMWIHHAPAITGDIQSWYGADGQHRDWKAIAYAIFHFVQTCYEHPDQLAQQCQEFSALPYIKGLQAGMMTPILNALRPDDFLLINSKPQKVINYFSDVKCSTKLIDYPTINQHEKALVLQLAPVMQTIWEPNLRQIDQFDMFCHWLVSLKKYTFSSTAGTAPAFNEKAFDLLAKLHQNSSKSIYDEHKSDFNAYVINPFKHLMLGVSTRLPESIKEVMETQKGLFGQILKNDYGQGGAYEYYWGAFHQKGVNRTRSVQLLMVIGFDFFTFSFEFGHHSDDYRKRFVANCQRHQVELIKLLSPTFAQTDLIFGDPKTAFTAEGIAIAPDSYSFAEWLANIALRSPRAAVTWSKDKVLSTSTEALVTEICQVYTQLFPLVLLAIEHDPMPCVKKYLNVNVKDEELMLNHDCPFSPTTFDLLSKLHSNPHKIVYDKHKPEFETYLINPFQHLMQTVAQHLPAAMTDLLETNHRIFARIPKNDFGQGGAWDFYWGAFYPKGGRRVEDAQMFLWINHEYLECGFYIGRYGSEQRQRFLENCHQYQAELVDLLQPTLAQAGVIFGDRADTVVRADGVVINGKGIDFQEWVKAPDASDIHVSFPLAQAQVLSRSEADLVTFIVQAYEHLFPLVLLATLNEPMPVLQEYLLGGDESTKNGSYLLSQCAADTYLPEDELRKWVDAIERKRQAILYGPPGTGKTYLAEHLARYLLSEGDGFHEIVQFHPAYTYEDFVQGIRPQAGKTGLEYPVVPGRFLRFCEKARDCNDTCVLIIDEINRANLAQVFGELMYLLEYRGQSVELASGRTFSIPPNVRIIGTMNTADRSIALVDHALRRRFAFLPLYPNMAVLRAFHQETEFSVEPLIQLLQQINHAIGDRQYELGTSFFMRKQLRTELESIWKLEIQPYLEEYFFDRPDEVKKFYWDAINKQLNL